MISLVFLLSLSLGSLSFSLTLSFFTAAGNIVALFRFVLRLHPFFTLEKCGLVVRRRHRIQLRALQTASFLFLHANDSSSQHYVFVRTLPSNKEHVSPQEDHGDAAILRHTYWHSRCRLHCAFGGGRGLYKSRAATRYPRLYPLSLLLRATLFVYGPSSLSPTNLATMDAD